MKFKISDRVTSSEVEPIGDGVYQQKQLQIVEFLENEKVRCKSWIESQVNPKIEYFDVTIASLTFVSKKGLDYKGIDQDSYFKKYRKR